MTPDRSAVTAAMVALLEQETGLLVGDGRTPPDAPNFSQTPTAAPILIVYELPGAPTGRDADGTTDGAVLSYQLTAVGRLREQVTRALERAETALTRAALAAQLEAPVAAVDVESTSAATPNATGTLVTAVETVTVAVFRTA